MLKNDCYKATCSALEKNGMLPSDLTWVKSACSIIDKMVDDGEVDFMQSTISSDKIIITLEHEVYMSLDECSTHPFFELIKMFDKFSFSAAEVDRPRIELTKDLSRVG